MSIRSVSLQIMGVFLVLGLSAIKSPAEPSNPKNLQIMILDDSGSLAEGVHVYIYSLSDKKFFETRDVKGTAAFDLPAGKYRVSAAKTLNANGYIDHFASPEAEVRLEPGEPTSIILSLHKAEDEQPDVLPTSLNAHLK